MTSEVLPYVYLFGQDLGGLKSGKKTNFASPKKRYVQQKGITIKGNAGVVRLFQRKQR